MTKKKHYTILWDFDGTLLPSNPYDSEQSLMLYKLHQTAERIPILNRALARVLLYADRKEHLRKVFKQFYIRFMTGTDLALLDLVCTRMAERISEVDRNAVRSLADNGHRMIVLSCGTADLGEKILGSAGIINCFENIIGNRFETINGRISGMTLHVPNPEDKVRYVKEQKMNPKTCVAVGDGYTDIPILDWAEISILVDRTGKKQFKYAHKNYQFVKSLTEISDMI